MNDTSNKFQSRQAWVQGLLDRIERDMEELNRIHERLFAGNIPHDEYIRLTGRRNNLVFDIQQKEDELSRLTGRKSNQSGKAKYSY